MFQQLPMFQRIGPAAYKKDLTNTLAFCERLGQPQTAFPSIHIAGTNGKGSTAHMLSAIFTAAGYKTGLYTSPHYRDFRERVKINGQLIPKGFVTAFVNEHLEFASELKPSFFEWTVALAFDYFAKEKVDIAIIETGLGGRLDSTNVITPIVSVITNISFDHQNMLGDTLPLIAGEKAGIIKQGIPVVIGETHAETAPVFLAKAKHNNSPIFFADQTFEVIPLRASDAHIAYEIKEKGKTMYQGLEVNLLGDYQRKNIQTVIHSLQLVAPQFVKLNNPQKLESAIRTGLANLKSLSNFMGRWEFLSKNPSIICDSAHNEDGIRLAMSALEKIPHGQLHFVFGTVNDKSPDKVLNLLPKKAKYYFAKANIPRGMDPNLLMELANTHQLHGKAYRSVKLALAAAKKSAKPNDLIFVGGSIFVVAEVI